MNITLNPQAETFVQHKLDSGSYNSPSDLINEALYLMSKYEKRLTELKTEIQIGIEQAERGEWVDKDVRILKGIVPPRVPPVSLDEMNAAIETMGKAKL